MSPRTITPVHDYYTAYDAIPKMHTVLREAERERRRWGAA